MSAKKTYYSATENDNPHKILKIVLCLCLVGLFVAGGVFAYIYASNQTKQNQIDTQIVGEKEQFLVNVLVCVVDKDNEDSDPKFTLVSVDG